MKILFAPAMVLACAAALGAQAGAPQGATPAQMKMVTLNRTAIEKMLMDNEQKINDAVMKGDLATFKSIVAAEAWQADASGFMSAAEFEKMWKPGMAKLTDVKLTGFKVLWLDDTSAVLTYTWSGKGTFMDQPVTSPTFSSTVYAKRGDKWMAVYHQETAKAPEPPRK